MANARREVDLVIKAKDDAAKVVDAITAALNGMSDAQANLLKSTKKTGGGIGDLVKAVSDLDKVLRGGSGTERLAADLGKAEKALAGLKGNISSTANELTELKTRAAQAATATGQLNASVKQLDQSVSAQNAALKKNKAEHAALKAELTAQESAVKKLTKAVPTLTGQLDKQTAKVGDTQAKFGALAAELEATQNPAKALQSAFDRTAATLERQQARLTELNTRLDQTKVQLAEAGAAAGEFAARVEQSAAGIASQQAAIAQTKTQLSQLKQQSREAAAGQRDLEASIESTAAALERQEASLTGAEKSYVDLTAATQRAEQGMAELAAAARGPLSQAIAAQRGLVSQVSQEYQKVRGELAQVGAAMDRVGVPTREMMDTYQGLQRSLREIDSEFQRQRQVFSEMKTAYNGLTGDTVQLTQTTERFEQAMQESAATLQRVQQISRQAATSVKTLGAATAQAASQQTKVTQEVKATATATAAAAQKTNTLSQAYRNLYGETRQALSYTQRLRGEVLALISAYGGIFGVIQGLTGVVEATQKVEGAQVRLTALYDGNAEKAGAEFEFVSRTANKLGIDIGELADQYTKFAAATKGTRIAGQQTRDIFLSVAEAGRVNGLSMDDMSGIFRALVQIASKGKVQLEELSGQLGDRLPGALQIMAAGLGKSVEELLEMTKEGEVSSDALAKFADELERRYGDALPAALLTTSAAIGRFKNALTQAYVEFGKAGFIEGFISMLDSLTATMKSADFKAFAANLSAAFGVLAKTIGFVAENFKVLVAVATTFLGLRLLPVVGALAAGFVNYSAGISKAATAQRYMVSTMTAGVTTISATSGALIGLRAAITGLLASTGVGLLVAAIGTGIAYWATAADTATEAIQRHNEIVDQAKGAYDKAGLSVQEWRKEVAKLTTTEVLLNTDELTEQLQKSRDEVAAIGDALRDTADMIPSLNKDPKADAQRAELAKLTEQFSRGAVAADVFRKRLDEIAQTSANEFIKNTATGLITASKSTVEWEEKLKRNKDILIALNGTQAEAEAALKRLSGALDDNKSGLDDASESTKGYQEALNGLKEFIPGLSAELEKLQELAKLDEAYKKVQLLSRNIGMATEAYNQYQAARQIIDYKFREPANYGNTRGTPSGEEYSELVSATTKLAQEMNLSVEDLLTAIHYESGFRSQIMGGKGGQYFGLFQASPDVRKEFGIGPGSSITDQIEAFGKYLKQRGVMPGDNLLPIYAAINAGNAKYINRSDEANGGLPGDVSDKVASAKMEQSRREAEALLKAYGGYERLAKEAYDTEEKRAETLAAINLSESEALKLAEVEKQYKDSDLVTRTTELELEKKRLELAREGLTLTPEMEASIRRRVELQEREKSNQEVINNSKSAAEQAEARFNAILQQRQALLAQAETLKASGNEAGAQEAIAQANALKASLDQAALAAIAMWQKIGGPEAQAAIEKIKQANLESQTLKSTGNQLTQMWTAVGDSLMNNLSTAIDEFAQAVANGENAWKALGRAMQKAAAQFLIDIGKMIVKQMLFNLLSGIFPGMANPLGGAVAHAGTGSGTIGSNRSNRTRTLDASVWNNAPRFHSGRNSGLSSKEMPAILENTEAVMTAESPFHPNNQAKTLGAVASAASSGGGRGNIRIINAVDSASVLEEALNTPAGESAIINHWRKNKSTYQEVMS